MGIFHLANLEKRLVQCLDKRLNLGFSDCIRLPTTHSIDKLTIVKRGIVQKLERKLLGNRVGSKIVKVCVVATATRSDPAGAIGVSLDSVATTYDFVGVS